jgi:hypothetical protein
MVLQMEDCIDVMHALYPDYDVLFLFDHSCGHDRQRKDGLNLENMSKNYGWKQSLLRPTHKGGSRIPWYLPPYPTHDFLGK